MSDSGSSIPLTNEKGVASSDAAIVDSVESIAKASVIGFLVGSISGWLHVSKNASSVDGASKQAKATIDVYGKEVTKSNRALPTKDPSLDSIHSKEVNMEQSLKQFEKLKPESKLDSSRPTIAPSSSSVSSRNSHLTNNLHHTMPRSSFTSSAGIFFIFQSNIWFTYKCNSILLIAAPPVQEEIARRITISGLQFGIVTAVMSSTLAISQLVFGHDKDSVAFGAAGLTGGLTMGIVQRPFQLLSTFKKGILLGSLTFGYSVVYDQFIMKDRKRKNND